jgi:preprotein translocase subunit SecG
MSAAALATLLRVPLPAVTIALTVIVLMHSLHKPIENWIHLNPGEDPISIAWTNESVMNRMTIATTGFCGRTKS